MGKPLKTYDLMSVFLLVGGYRIGGYGEEGGIDVEWSSDLVETSVGADGQATASRSNDASATVTITVKETSRSYRDLATLMAAQQSQEAILPLQFRLKDDRNGDKINDDNAVFINRPGVSKKKKAGEREFKLFLPNAGESAAFGASIAL